MTTPKRTPQIFTESGLTPPVRAPKASPSPSPSPSPAVEVPQEPEPESSEAPTTTDSH